METKTRKPSLVSSVSTNESDILSDMIPYRCPKCGNQRRFTALRDLKLHLDVEHSFKMGCVKPRSRNEVFNHKLVKEGTKVTTGTYVKTKHGGKFSPRSSESETSYGSMLKYYDDEAKVLEMKVKMAKEKEIANKLNRNIFPKSKGDNKSESPVPGGDNLKESFNNVNNQLLKSRHKEWRASEALYQAEDIIQGVEEAAENRCLDQQVVIRDLVNDLRQKEGQLNRANSDLDKVRREREGLMLEVEELFSEANTGNSVLKEELGRREHMLGDVNRQLDSLKARARLDLNRKEDELIAAERRVEALEKEREHLVQGTNTLLEQADRDREVLQHTVQTKETELRHVNKELDKLKMEQSELVKESIGLYEKANEGTARLTHLVQAKDNQLQEAFQELESMKKVHEKLIWQSKTLTEQADSNNQTLTEMLQSKEEELKQTKLQLSKVKENNMSALKEVLTNKEAELLQARDELAKVKAETADMMENVQNLTQKASDQNVKMIELQNQVQEKEEKLQEKERNLDSLKKFLNSAAEKEVVARSKLEQFIRGLIDRADKAESELHQIRSRSLSEVDVSRSHTLGDVSDVMESDLDGQWSSHEGQKVRARSQDSTLKSTEYTKVSADSNPKASTRERPTEASLQKNRPKNNTNVQPWQKILRRNCLSDSQTTDDSEVDFHNKETELDLNVIEKHQNTQSNQVDRPQPMTRQLKTLIPLDKSVLTCDRKMEMNQSKQTPGPTGPQEDIRKNKSNHVGDNVKNSVVNPPDLKHLQTSKVDAVLNISEAIPNERADNVFHFGKSENDRNGGYDPMPGSFQTPRNKANITPSMESEYIPTRGFPQFAPQPPRFSKTVPFSEYSRQQNGSSVSHGIIRMPADYRQNVSHQAALQMSHPSSEQMVPRNFVARSQSETGLNQTNKSTRSHQLNQQLVNSAQCLNASVQNYHHENPYTSSHRTVPVVRNVSAPQNRHIDIPSYSTDISSSQRYPIGPFPNAKGHEYSQRYVSTSQRIPFASPFREDNDQHFSVSSSQRLTLDNTATQKNLSFLPPRYEAQITLPNDFRGGESNLGDVQVNQGQTQHVIQGAQGNYFKPGLKLGGGDVFRSDGIQQGHNRTGKAEGVNQNHLGGSNGIQQIPGQTVLGSEGQVKEASNDSLGHVVYIPVDPRTGQLMHLPRVQDDTSLNGTTGITQTHRSPIYHASGPEGKQSQGGEEIERENTCSRSKDVVTPTINLDQSQTSVTNQHQPVYKNDEENNHSPVIPADQKSKHISSAESNLSHELSRSSSTSIVDGNCDHDNSLSDVLSLVDYENDMDEPDDVESATFEQFMDENGILWELTDSCRDQSARESVNQENSGYTTGGQQSSTQMPSKLIKGQVASHVYGLINSENLQAHFHLTESSGTPVSNQRVPARSKSVEITPRNRVPSLRNRSMSPRVRFNDQKQYCPYSDDDVNQNTSSASVQGPLSEGGSIQRSVTSHSQSETKPLENSSNSVTESKPNFEELWLRDVSIGTDTPSLDSYVPFEIQSSRPPSKQKSVIVSNHSNGRKKDQGCQPLKDSSTQTWLLDCPISLDDLGSVSQRSSFVRSQKPVESDSVKTVSVFSTEAETLKPTFELNERSLSPKHEVQCRSSHSGFKDHSNHSNSAYQNHNNSLRPRVEDFSLSASQKLEQDGSYQPSTLKTETNGQSYHDKYHNKPVLNSSFEPRHKGNDGLTDHSGDSTCNEQKNIDLSLAITHENVSEDGRSYRISGTRNIQEDRHKNVKDSRSRNDQFSDTDFGNNKCKYQGRDKHQYKGYECGNSKDYKNAREIDDQFPNGKNGNSQSSGSEHSNEYSPPSMYRKGQSKQTLDSRFWKRDSPVRHHKSRKDGRKISRSPASRYRQVGKDRYSDEYDDSNEEWTDNDWYKNRRKHFHRRERKIRNDYGKHNDLDIIKRGNNRKTFRNYISSNSESDSLGSGYTRGQERYKSSDRRSSLTQIPHHEDAPMTTQNEKSDDTSMLLKTKAEMAFDKQSASKLFSISSNEEAKSNSHDTGNDSAVYISEKFSPKVGSEMVMHSKGHIDGCYTGCNKEQIAQQSVPGSARPESEYEKNDVSLVKESEGREHRHNGDIEVEPMTVDEDDPICMDVDDQYSMYSIGSSLSRTSSQESILDSLPKSRREAIRQRRITLYLVFRFLDTKSLGRVAGVCREWKKVSRQSTLWKRIHLCHTRCTSKNLETMSRWCTQLESLHLEDIYTRKQLELESDEDFAQAVRASLEAGVECLLQVSESTLKSITIINCLHVLTDKCMWLASCYSRMLETVCYRSNIHVLGADVLWALGAGCGLIRSLDIAPLYPCANTEKFTNKCLQIISQFLPELDYLCIGGQQLDVNGFILLAKSCQRLYSLSLRGCDDVVEDVAIAMCRKGLKNLRSLDFNHTPVTDKALLHFYSSCKHLKSIHVTFCLEDVSTDPGVKVNTEKFNKRIKTLEKLKKKGGLWNILKLEVQSIPD